MDLTAVISFLALGAAGALVPIALMWWMSDSLRGLGLACLLSLPVLTLFGAFVFAWIYGSQSGYGSLAYPGALAHFLSLGLRAGLIWVPILALTAFGLAMGIERRKGERMAARDPE